MNKLSKKIVILLTVLVMVGLGMILTQRKTTPTSTATDQTTSAKQTTKKQKKAAKKTAEKKAENALPDVKSSDWQLVLINKNHPAKDGDIQLKSWVNGQQMDERIYADFQALVTAGKKAGISYIAISGYRSVAYQKELLDKDIKTYENQGMSADEARKKALEYMTEPGVSEHHTGLAIDVLDEDWYNAGKSLETSYGESKGGLWLAENAMNYGFIIRYTQDKESLTGIKYEPWHLRYVGKESAQYITKHQLVLEEYLTLLKKVGK